MLKGVQPIRCWETRSKYNSLLRQRKGHYECIAFTHETQTSSTTGAY